MEERKVVIGGVSYSVHFPPSSKLSPLSPPPPLIFVIHGRTQSLERYDFLCSRLCCEVGAITVSFDAGNHGSRLIDPLRNLAWTETLKTSPASFFHLPNEPSPSSSSSSETPVGSPPPPLISNPTHAIDMYSQMLEVHHLVSLAMTFLPSYGISFSSASIVGVSQGAHASLLAFTHNPSLSYCVSIMGAGDYISLMKIRYEKLRQRFLSNPTPSTPPSFRDVFPESLEEVCLQKDIIHNLESLALSSTRDLLLLHGADDDLVPTHLSHDLVRRGQENGVSISLQVYEGVGHSLAQKMVDDSVQYFATRLRGNGEKL